MLHYCEKCGRIINIPTFDKYAKYECDCCKSKVKPVPIEFLDYKEEVDYCPFKNNGEEKRFIEEYIKTSPELDPYLFEHRNEILSQKSANFQAKLTQGKSIIQSQSNIPKCPTCGSTNICKIGFGERMLSVGTFGLLSKKMNKTFKCKNCSYTW